MATKSTESGRTSPSKEWLVTDQHGAFAMGTTAGIRNRKYHGFYLGIPGRSETAFLTDFEFRLNGKPIWPHCYDAVDGPVLHPDPLTAAKAFTFESVKTGPRWRWDFPEGKLTFAVEGSPHLGGIRLKWKWQGAARARGKPVHLEIRPFCAMRPLHGMGGQTWSLGQLKAVSGSHKLAEIHGQSGQDAALLLDGPFEWKTAPIWHERFYYSEEAARGYLAHEDLYSAGSFNVDLKSCPDSACSWLVAESSQVLLDSLKPSGELFQAPAALDFVLRDPAGIVAGYPWFGEWGRDTFISLPGIAMAWIKAGGNPDEVWEWAQEILLRWGEWIRMTGMIPNLIEKGGSHQWDSADGTLWWCHAVTGLWTFSLGDTGLFPDIESKFAELLHIAIDSIRLGRHLFLRVAENGLLEVTEPHSTWMDARVDGVAVTPRLGALPEINALWFQAHCLHWIWTKSKSTDADEIKRLGKLVLGCKEVDRPNMIFLHSIPLAPSFVLNDSRSLGTDLKIALDKLWTPVGLRTLSPNHPGYRPRCEGDQTTRDQAYHQGPPWGWLGGHFEMARNRFMGALAGENPEDIKKTSQAEWNNPIAGHLPELFDAEFPFTPRGTPAQAWSLACAEEATARRKGRVDAKLTQLLAQRWMERLDRQSEAEGERRP